MTKKSEHTGVLKAVSVLQRHDASGHLYDRWAKDYDHDLMNEWGYRAPDISLDCFEKLCPDRDAAIIDLGCGTGLVGEALKARGYKTFDGLDISTGMLTEARKKTIYRDLFEGDLTAHTALPDAAYDGLLCIGSMGAGHVDAEHSPEMIRLVKPGRPLVLYMNGAFYDRFDYEATFRRFETEGLWQLLTLERSNYMDTLERPGWLVAARRS